MGPSVSRNGQGQLFLGAKFWISQNVPQRSRFREMIEEHGGCVVLMEKDADMKLVDHTRKNLPPDTYSYKYVERSVQHGMLEDPEVHRVGPSASRPMGATQIPKKGTRSDYSLKDDQIVYDWVYPFEQEPGAPINGNKIYQALEREFPQHTWQSWRSRYTRTLRGKPRPGGGEPRPDLVHPDYKNQPRRQLAQLPMKSPESKKASTARILFDPARTLKRKGDSSPNTSTPPSGLVSSPAKRRAKEVCQNVQSTQSSPQRHLETPQIPKSKHKTLATLESPTVNAPDQMDLQSGAQRSQLETSDNTKSAQNRAITPFGQSIQTPDQLFLEMPFFPSSPEPEDDDEEHREDVASDIDSWIDAQVNSGRADESVAIAAIRCTSMDPKLAEAVLEQWNSEKGIPENMPGAWTAEDDRCLEGKDARGIERVLTKHGQDGVNSRWKYFRNAREAGLIQ